MFGKKIEKPKITVEEEDRRIHEVIKTVYNALEEKGYNPVEQILGYLLSDDETYITGYNNAKKIIRTVDREDVIKCLIRHFINS